MPGIPNFVIRNEIFVLTEVLNLRISYEIIWEFIFENITMKDWRQEDLKKCCQFSFAVKIRVGSHYNFKRGRI